MHVPMVMTMPMSMLMMGVPEMSMLVRTDSFRRLTTCSRLMNMLSHQHAILTRERRRSPPFATCTSACCGIDTSLSRFR